MTVAPGSTWSVTKGCSEAADASASGNILARKAGFDSVELPLWAGID